MFKRLWKLLPKHIKICIIVILYHISKFFSPEIEFRHFNIVLWYYISVGLVQLILLIQYCYHYSKYIGTLGIADVMPYILTLVILFIIYLRIGKSLKYYRIQKIRWIICVLNIIIHIELVVYLICLWYF